MEAEAFTDAYSTRCVSPSARKNTEDVAESARTVLRLFLSKTAGHNDYNNKHTFDK